MILVSIISEYHGWVEREREREREEERGRDDPSPLAGADPNVRDYGGRRPIDILSNKANERARSKPHPAI